MKTFRSSFFPVFLRLIVAGIFFYAGVSQLSDPQAFARSIHAYRLPLDKLENLIALLLPPLEILAALALFWKKTRDAASLILGTLTVVFLLALSQAFLRGFSVDCACFGVSDSPPGPRGMMLAIVRDILLLAAIAGQLWNRPNRPNQPNRANSPNQSETHTSPPPIPPTNLHVLLLLALLISLPSLHAGAPILQEAPQAITTVRLAPIPGMIRAELKHDAIPPQCEGVLLLCPGYNGDGEYLIRKKGWRDLAKKHRLLLVALSFASKEEDLSAATRRGYYYVEKGSGKLLLDGLKKIAGKELPVSLFGYSGGAHFTHRFVYAHPEKVRVWGVYGFGWFDDAPANSKTKPPGIFVCGVQDQRLAATRDAFFSALRAQWRVAWHGVPNSGHIIERNAAVQIRNFFDDVLSMSPDAPGTWREITNENGLDGFSVRTWSPPSKKE